MEKVLILHNIRSVQNVGAIFRTCDAIGIDTIILSGYTPTPLDRFGRIRKDMAKTALGAEKNVPWEYFKTITPVMKKLKTKGFEIVAAEQSNRSIDYKKYKPKDKVAILMGTEVSGISPATLQKCDVVLELPMNGKKESLNVSVTAGIVLYRLFDN